MTFAPHNTSILGPQEWEERTTLAHAKPLLGCLGSDKTRLIWHANSFPKAIFDTIFIHAHRTLSATKKEISNVVIANGQTKTTHICLLHNLFSLLNGKSDKEDIRRKKAHFAMLKSLFAPNLTSGQKNWPLTFGLAFPSLTGLLGQEAF